MNRALHSDSEEFFEKPSKKKLKNVLSKHFGEFDHVDFKGAWPEASSLARHVLAMANSEGGALIFGVRQDKAGVFHADGLGKFEDKATVKDGLKKHISDALPPAGHSRLLT